MKLAHALVLGTLALSVAGCHHGTVVVESDGTKGTISTDNGGKVTYSDDKGQSMKLGTGVSEAELGLPFYPGSTEVPNGSSVVDATDGKSIMCSRTSKDDPAKVGDFYKDKLTGVQSATTDSGGTKMVMTSGKLGASEVVVNASKTGTEDTKIIITVGTKKTK